MQSPDLTLRVIVADSADNNGLPEVGFSKTSCFLMQLFKVHTGQYSLTCHLLHALPTLQYYEPSEDMQHLLVHWMCMLTDLVDLAGAIQNLFWERNCRQ